ncbi:DinB family protein [Bacillus sp. 1P06AnD]
MDNFDHVNSIEKRKKLNEQYHKEVSTFVNLWNPSMETRILYEQTPNGHIQTSTWNEVMHHIIVHDIHHIGQLPVWAREEGITPVTANVIGRNIFSE